MSTAKAKALQSGKTIGGRSVDATGTDQRNWGLIHLSHVNHRLAMMARLRVAKEDAAHSGGDFTQYIPIAEVAERLVVNLENPIHYEDNTPGYCNSSGERLVPDPKFSYWDLYQYGVTGEDGLEGFLRDCGLPLNTAEPDVLIATGLLLADSAATAIAEKKDSLASYLLGQAQDSAEEAMLLLLADKDPDQVKTAIADEMKSRSSAAARSRYAQDKDGKQAVKAWVRECWDAWQISPEKYPSAAAFARDMLDKQPEKLTSSVVVERWARDWSKQGK